VYWLVIQATVWHDIDLQVTGFSIGSGLLYALDTMCSQSFGAGNLKVRTIEMLCSGVFVHVFVRRAIDTSSANLQEVGVTAQRAFYILAILCVPLIIFWSTTERLLLLLGQEPEIARLSGLYVRVITVVLPFYFLLEIQKRYLQCQSIVLPIMLLSFAVVPINALNNYLLIYVFELGYANQRDLTHVLIMILTLSRITRHTTHCQLHWSTDLAGNLVHFAVLHVDGVHSHQRRAQAHVGRLDAGRLQRLARVPASRYPRRCDALLRMVRCDVLVLSL